MENKEHNYPKKEKSPLKKAVSYIYEWLDSAVFSMFAVILLFTFFFGIVGVEGESMENTLFQDDKLIISHFNYTPKQGDIVIISRNHENDKDMIITDFNKPLVKRIVAVGGQTVEVKDGKVYVDGKEIDEPYTKTPTDNKDMDGPVEVPQGYVFTMGDNRYGSHDSRADDIGVIDERYILGKAIFRIFPINEFTKF
ncbi:MAG: signal peptidase I [Clostridia bacterium]|nr:signal peptidase I [Clostridia bacterium]